MNLNIRTDSIISQKEFLHSTKGLINKVGGVTLDSTKFTAGTTVKAGTAIAVGKVDNSVTYSKGTPYAKIAGTVTVVGRVYVTAHDIDMPSPAQDVVVGVIESGYLKQAKVTGITGSETNFVSDSNYRFHLR